MLCNRCGHDEADHEVEEDHAYCMGRHTSLPMPNNDVGSCPCTGFQHPVMNPDPRSHEPHSSKCNYWIGERCDCPMRYEGMDEG